MTLQLSIGAVARVFRVQPGPRRFASAPTAVRADHAECDSEQPRAEWTSQVQRRPVAGEDHQNVLPQIVDIARRSTKTLQGGVQVVELSIESADAVSFRPGFL